jgi:hypothetical protein
LEKAEAKVKELEKDKESLVDEIDHYHRIAADARDLLYNGGAGANLSQQKQIDLILQDIAGIADKE